MIYSTRKSLTRQYRSRAFNPFLGCLLAIFMPPCVVWQLHGNAQPKAYNSDRHDVCKFSAPISLARESVNRVVVAAGATTGVLCTATDVCASQWRKESTFSVQQQL